jgi:fructokinase
LRDTVTLDGVDLALIGTTDTPTTLAIAELDERGAATYRFHTAQTSSTELTDAAVTSALATRPHALHLGTLGLVLEPMASALAAGVADAATETLVMLDPNCRPVVIPDRATYLVRLNAVLARTDVVKVSADDLAYLAPDVPAIQAAGALLDHGPSAVLLTDGARAVVVLTRAGMFEIGVPPVEVIDTVGAGDAFGGAFLARWIEQGLGRADLTDRAALREAVEFAIVVASATCRRPGAEPPRRSELAWPPG